MEDFEVTISVSDRDIKMLETVEDIQNRREEVLKRYSEFKAATIARRKRLEDAKRYYQFKRDADEVEAWINERLQIATEESYKDPTNLQVRLNQDTIILPKFSATFFRAFTRPFVIYSLY